jgi:hypothetical protein
MLKEHWEELQAQVEEHGPEVIDLILQTDDGEGHIWINDVKFEDGRVIVLLG